MSLKYGVRLLQTLASVEKPHKRAQLRDGTRAIGVDYHPGAVYDMRSRRARGLGTPGQQCTYDARGYLIWLGPGAGTPDKIHPDYGGHGSEDVTPYEWALKLEAESLESLSTYTSKSGLRTKAEIRMVRIVHI